MAAYDARDHRIFLARDRMGICPEWHFLKRRGGFSIWRG
jgi:asparagine synthetase B (glutamine-hydrolysing)